MSPQSQAMFFTLLPIFLVTLILFAMVKWGGARLWHVVVIVLAWVVLSRTIIGPPIQQGLSQLPWIR